MCSTLTLMLTISLFIIKISEKASKVRKEGACNLVQVEAMFNHTHISSTIENWKSEIVRIYGKITQVDDDGLRNVVA